MPFPRLVLPAAILALAAQGAQAQLPQGGSFCNNQLRITNIAIDGTRAVGHGDWQRITATITNMTGQALTATINTTASLGSSGGAITVPLNPNQTVTTVIGGQRVNLIGPDPNRMQNLPTPGPLQVSCAPGIHGNPDLRSPDESPGGGRFGRGG